MRMTKVYIVRHCEAAGNSQRLFQGSTDCDITELGVKQLSFLRERFESVPLDKIYTSPLVRAKKTAEAIRGGRDVEVIVCDGVIEIHGGVVEGKPFKEAFKSIPGVAEAWNDSPQDFWPEGGESMRNAYERIWKAVCEIAESNSGKTVAVATHGGVIRCLNCRLVYGTIERLKDTPWCENTGVTLLTFDDAMNVTLEYMNDRTHVSDEFLPKRSRMAEVISIDNNVG